MLAVQRAPATMGPWTWRCSFACGEMGCFEPCCQHELLVRNFATADSKVPPGMSQRNCKNRNARLCAEEWKLWKQWKEQARQLQASNGI